MGNEGPHLPGGLGCEDAEAVEFSVAEVESQEPFGIGDWPIRPP